MARRPLELCSACSTPLLAEPPTREEQRFAEIYRRLASHGVRYR